MDTSQHANEGKKTGGGHQGHNAETKPLGLGRKQNSLNTSQHSQFSKNSRRSKGSKHSRRTHSNQGSQERTDQLEDAIKQGFHNLLEGLDYGKMESNKAAKAHGRERKDSEVGVEIRDVPDNFAASGGSSQMAGASSGGLGQGGGGQGKKGKGGKNNKGQSNRNNAVEADDTANNHNANVPQMQSEGNDHQATSAQMTGGGNNNMQPGFGRGKSQRKNFNRQNNKDKNNDQAQAHHKERNQGGRRGGPPAGGADQADYKYRPIKDQTPKEPGTYENTKEDEFQQHPSGGSRKKHQQYDSYHGQAQHHFGGGKQHSQGYKNQQQYQESGGTGGPAASTGNNMYYPDSKQYQTNQPSGSGGQGGDHMKGGRQQHQSRHTRPISSPINSRDLSLKEQHTSESSGLPQLHRTQLEKELQQVQYSQNKPIFVVDADSQSIESYESLELTTMHPNDTVGATSFNFEESTNDFLNVNSSTDITGRQSSMTQGHTDHQPWLQPFDQYSMGGGQQQATNQAGTPSMPQRSNQPIIVLQGHRNGFLEQYIYTEQQLEQMKLQQQQKEMTMKPWERDIQELERYFAKTMEAENMKLNSTAVYQQSSVQEDPSGRPSLNQASGNMGGAYGASNGGFNGGQDPMTANQGGYMANQQNQMSSTLALIQYHKERNKKEVLAQYFNYGFVEESFKTYINQQVQKFYEQSRITQALNAQQDGKDDDEESESNNSNNNSTGDKKTGPGESTTDKKDKNQLQKQSIYMYKEYLEQRAHRQIYKQIREDLKQQQTIMQQQIQIQLQQQQQALRMQQMQAQDYSVAASAGGMGVAWSKPLCTSSDASANPYFQPNQAPFAAGAAAGGPTSDQLLQQQQLANPMGQQQMPQTSGGPFYQGQRMQNDQQQQQQVSQDYQAQSQSHQLNQPQSTAAHAQQPLSSAPPPPPLQPSSQQQSHFQQQSNTVGVVAQPVGDQQQMLQMPYPITTQQSNPSQSPPPPSANGGSQVGASLQPGTTILAPQQQFFQPQQAAQQQTQYSQLPFSTFLHTLEIHNPLNYNPNQLSILNNLAGYQQQQQQIQQQQFMVQGSPGAGTAHGSMNAGFASQTPVQMAPQPQGQSQVVNVNNNAEPAENREKPKPAEQTSKPEESDTTASTQPKNRPLSSSFAQSLSSPLKLPDSNSKLPYFVPTNQKISPDQQPRKSTDPGVPFTGPAQASGGFQGQATMLQQSQVDASRTSQISEGTQEAKAQQQQQHPQNQHQEQQPHQTQYVSKAQRKKERTEKRKQEAQQ